MGCFPINLDLFLVSAFFWTLAFPRTLAPLVGGVWWPAVFPAFLTESLMVGIWTSGSSISTSILTESWLKGSDGGMGLSIEFLDFFPTPCFLARVTADALIWTKSPNLSNLKLLKANSSPYKMTTKNYWISIFNLYPKWSLRWKTYGHWPGNEGSSNGTLSQSRPFRR